MSKSQFLLIGLNSLIALGACIGQSVLSAQATQPAVKEHVDHNALVKLAWQMGCQTESFGSTPLFELLEVLHPLRVHHLELGLGQKISAENPAAIGPEMPAVDLDTVMAKMKSLGMDFVSYGVVKLDGDEAHTRKVFEFAAKLKVKNIVADAPAEALEGLDKLAQSFQINVAILNGPAGTEWADPDKLAKAVAGRSNRVGICADIANWRRMGFSPLESIQKFPGRVIEIRLSDVKAGGDEVPLGAGNAEAARTLAWLKQQNFKGVCAIGYSSGGSGQERVNNWVRSANAFSDVVVQLAAGK